MIDVCSCGAGDDGHVITSKQSTTAFTMRYEALREHVIARHPDVVRHGIALLLRQGMAAWMRACREMAPTPDTVPAANTVPSSCSVPDGATTEIVHVLAAMALLHMEAAHP